MTGENGIYIASHPTTDSEEGVALPVKLEFISIVIQVVIHVFHYYPRIRGKMDFLSQQDYQTILTQDDLKYCKYQLYVNSADLMSGSNVTCYKMKRS